MKLAITLLLAFAGFVRIAARPQFPQFSQYPAPYPYPRSFDFGQPPFPPQPQNGIEAGNYLFIAPNGAPLFPDPFNPAVPQQTTKPPEKDPDEKKKEEKDNKDDDKKKQGTTTPKPEDKDNDKDKENDAKKDEKKDKQPNVQYVPVPVYPPTLQSRSFPYSPSPYQQPFNPYPYPPFGYRPFAGKK